MSTGMQHHGEAGSVSHTGGDGMHTWPLFPVTVVGSLPRPKPLLDALRRKQAGRIRSARFDNLVAQAVRDAIMLQEQAGVDIVSDGEQRRDNFYSFITEAVEGIRLLTLAELLDYMSISQVLCQYMASWERGLPARS
jgi:methionine synthase II (cobalamin-independent)